MEIDVELQTKLSTDQAAEAKNELGGLFEFVELKSSGYICIRQIAKSDYGESVDTEISKYLASLEKMNNLIALQGGVVRVGVFFEVREIAAFSVVISDSTIQRLAAHNFSCDITCYPCDEDSDKQ